MENEQDGIWIIDVNARTTYVNDRMSEILGVSREEIIGQNSLDFIFAEDLERAQALLEAKKMGDSKPFRFRLRRKDGSAIWVNIQGTPMYNDVGEFKGVVGTLTVLH